MCEIFAASQGAWAAESPSFELSSSARGPETAGAAGAGAGAGAARGTGTV